MPQPNNGVGGPIFDVAGSPVTPSALARVFDVWAGGRQALTTSAIWAGSRGFGGVVSRTDSCFLRRVTASPILR